MKIHRILQSIFLCILFPTGSLLADRDADLTQVLNGVSTRSDTMLTHFMASPYPAIPSVLGNSGYALAALWKNTDLDHANSLINDLGSMGFDDLGIPDAFRLYELFNANSTFYPGRLTANSEAVLKSIFWNQFQLYGDSTIAVPSNYWDVDSSDNHDILHKSIATIGGAILASDPAYASRMVGSKTVAEHAAVWANYMPNYFQERGRKGHSIELGSPTYAQYSLEGIYLFRDFGPSLQLRRLAEMYLNLYYADLAGDLLSNSVRGGGKSRDYKTNYSTNGVQDSVQGFIYVLANLGGGNGAAYLAQATSTYRLPKPILDVMINPADRGSYTHLSRAPAANGTGGPNGFYSMIFPAFLRRYAYCTPGYIAGVFTIDPSRSYAAINGQNRWFGTVFSGGTTSRVFAQACDIGATHDDKTYDDLNGIGEGNALIVQRLTACHPAMAMRIYFGPDMYSTEVDDASGWAFAQDPKGTGYIAVRPATGSYTWDAPESGYSGRWLRPSVPSSPVVMQMGLSSDYTSFSAFQTQVKSQGFQWTSSTEFQYTPCIGQTITWHPDGASPQIGGVPVDLNPPKLQASPFLNWDFNSLTGTATSTAAYGSKTFPIDFSLYDSFVFEAESGIVTAPLTLQADGTASGGRCVTSSGGNGGKIDFAFSVPPDVPATGVPYTLWARVYWPNGSGNSFGASVDGGPSTVIGNDSAYGFWKWIKAQTYTLTAGAHNLTIAGNTVGARIDQLLLTSDPAFDPASETFTSEAEYGGLTAPMTYGSDPSASNGTFTYVPAGMVGGSVAFHFNVKTAGIYALQAQVNWPDSGQNSFYEQMDDGPTLTLGNNGPYGVWQSVNGSSYFLSAGNHVVTILARESGAKLDQITLTKVPDGPGSQFLLPAVTSSATASAQVNTAFSFAITATNSPTAFAATGLPPGLVLDPATGAIAGTPTTIGTYKVSIGATNAGGTGTATLVLSVTAGSTAPVISNVPNASVQVGQGFSYQITASNSPTSYAAVGLPAGLSVDAASGLIGGTAGTVGTFTVNLSATNAVGTGTATFALTVTSGPAVLPPVITSASSGDGEAGQAFSYQIVATNVPTSFAATGLPDGLSVDPATGLISGTPSAAGSYAVGLTATNAGGAGTATLALTLAPALPVATLTATTSTVTAGSGGQAVYRVTLSAAQDHDVFVGYSIKGTAANGTDYVLISDFKKIKAGKISKPIRIIPLGAGAGPGVTRTVALILRPGVGYRTGTTRRVKVKIIGE